MQESQTIDVVRSEIDLSPLDRLLDGSLRTQAKPAAGSSTGQAPGVRVGTLEAFSPDGVALVRFDGMLGSGPLPARQTCALSAADVGRGIVLVFEWDDMRRPIVLGVLRDPSPGTASGEHAPVEVTLDGERVTLTGKNEVVLRCGKASITLTKAGKVLIRGAYLLSRSSGVNRIKGGSVQIN